MSLVVCDNGKQTLLTQLLAWLNANTRLRLFQNNHTPVHGDTAAAYTEASFPGYAFIALTAWGAVTLTADFHALTTEALETFGTDLQRLAALRRHVRILSAGGSQPLTSTQS